MKNVIYLLIFLIFAIGNAQDQSTIAYMFQGVAKVGDEIEYAKLVESPDQGILIEVDINQKKYKFLIDTGASCSVLDKELFKNLLNSDQKIKIKDALGNEEEIDLFYLDFKIGENSFSDFAFIKKDLKKFLNSKCFRFDGIIGANVLKKLNWKFSKGDNKLYYSSKAFSYDGFNNPSRVQWHGNIPIVELAIKDYSFFAMIDTGHYGSIIMSEYAYNQNFKDYKGLIKGKSPVLSTINGKQQTQLMKTKIKNFFWGNSDLSDYEIIVLPVAPNIGNKIILENGFVFNFLTEEVALGRTANKSSYANLPKIKICKSKKREGEIELCFFWNELESKKLKLHDQIIQIDSVNTTHVDQKQYCDIIQNIEKGNAKIIRFKRGKKEFDYILN